MNAPRVNQTKLMLASREITDLLRRHPADNEAEASALVGVVLATAAAMATGYRGVECTAAQIERLVRAAQDAMNEVIKEIKEA